MYLRILNLSKDGETEELKVPQPDGVNKINPETIEVTMNMAEQNSKTLENIPIEVTGLPEEWNAEFNDPEDQMIAVILEGAAENLDTTNKGDIKAHIDASELSTGEHTVDIQTNGPQNVEVQPKSEKAKITIRGKEDSDTE
jgi:YbbR domain-containing protein